MAVPRIVPTKDGFSSTQLPFGEQNVVRLLTYLEGVPLKDVDLLERPFEDLGRFLGRLDHALSSFRHPAMPFELAWNSATVDRLSSLTEHIIDLERKALLRNGLAEFERQTNNSLSKLRRQVIHNDANLGNTLVTANDTRTITGLFDFGDVVYAPVVNEVAVAASYQISSRVNVIDMLTSLVGGYHQYCPLTLEDIALLPYLIKARLMTTLLITSWRASLFPANRNYILRNTDGAWSGLQLMAEIDVSRLVASLHQVCDLEA